MQRGELEELIQRSLPGARCEATDLTGTEDHWALSVEWAGFRGQDLLAQHRAVMAAVRPCLEPGGSGVIHAVQIRTALPQEQE